MATDQNIVVLIGRLTRDPELRQTQNSCVCKISIANNSSRKSGEEWVDEVSFFECQVWGRKAEVLNEHTKKGSQLAIQGRLKQNTWQDDQGQNKSRVIVSIESFQFLGKKEDSDQSGYNQNQGYNNQ